MSPHHISRLPRLTPKIYRRSFTRVSSTSARSRRSSRA
jgi:hypothetical protein